MAAIPRENLDDLLVQLLISNWFYTNRCTCTGDFFDPPDPTVGNGLRNKFQDQPFPLHNLIYPLAGPQPQPPNRLRGNRRLVRL